MVPGSLPRKADHVPVIAGGDEIGLFLLRIHQSAQDEAAQFAYLYVGFGQVKQHAGIAFNEEDGVLFIKEREFDRWSGRH